MRSHILWVLLAGLALPATGFAQDDAAVAKARKLNEEATASFEAGDFEEAADKYRAAYDTVPDPFLLGSESVAWFEAGDCERSLSVIDEFTATLSDGEALPNPLLKVRVGCAIRGAEAAIASDDYATAESELDRAAAMEGVTDAQSSRIAELRGRIDDERSAVVTAPDESPPRKGGSVRPVIGWGLVGLGAGLTAVSVVPGLAFADGADHYEQLRGECEPACSDAYDEEQAIRREMKRQRVVFYSLVGTGATMAAVGAVVLLTGSPPSDTQVFLTPTGVGLRGTFR